MNTPLILASTSPRRRDLMTSAGYQFEVHPPRDTAECGICSKETPPELVARLAYQKAADVGERRSGGLIIGCDTVAECCGQILGKPTSREHAGQMLRLLRGRVHHVYSGLCLIRQRDQETRVKVAVTKLKMDAVTDSQLEDYLDTELWEGKAGAFGYQDGVDWLQVLAGSESNVVGLPLELLAEMLDELHYSPG
ncbi:Maf family protein [Lignipirellula cremea]|uniref:dTTP/UTP pyrophosphatase n=1 Tax=Lignipirellula cremea TaxID=2528010 RepID=A0A518DNH9_9BACT|nr:Maf family protein [Lignipirellula cremea]QDU93394.1 Maf-like protein YhdE [Lignipirellula cremea]